MANNTQVEADEPSSGHPGLSVLSIARTVWKTKFWILSVWVVLSVVAVAVVRRLPAVYMAQSLILVDSQKIPEKFVSATVATDLDDRIAAIRQQLLSSGELKKVINEFGLYQKERKVKFEEEILELMRKDISIDPVTVGTGSAARTGAFRIGYQGPDAALVTRVANRLTTLYVDQNLKTREAQAEGTSEFLDTKVQEAKKRLDDLEAAVSSYKVQHNGELPEQQATLTAALSELNTRLQANMEASNRAQQTKIIQESQLGSLQTSEAAQVRALEQAKVAAAPGGQPARRQSEVLQEKLDLLRLSYREDWPEVVNTRNALEAAKRAEEQQQARALAPVPLALRPPDPPELVRTREQIAQLTAQIKAGDREMASRAAEQQQIQRDMESYRNRIARLPLREQEMQQITRDYVMAQENHKSLMAKQTDAAMSLDMERRQQSERFTVLEWAAIPERPLKPKRPQLYAAGSAGALALGVLLGFLIELRRDVFLGEWELPEGTTVLARLPYIEIPVHSNGTPPLSGGQGEGPRKRLAAASSILLCVAGVIAGGRLSFFDRL